MLVAIVLIAAIHGWWSRQPLNNQISQRNDTTTEQYQEQHGPAEGYWWPEFSARDTYAQWAMALLAGIGVGVSIVGVIWIRCTLIETRRTANAAIEANMTARRIGNAQIRSYVHIFPTNGPNPATLKEGGACVFSIANRGAIAATLGKLEGQAFVADFPLPDDHELPQDWVYLGEGGILHKSTTHNATVKSPPIIDLGVIEAVTSRSGTRLYFVARVRYSDAVGSGYFEQCCFSYNYNDGGPYGRFESANKHNQSY